jgi:hypothetical protein
MFNYFIGIDQTGAVNNNGMPKKMWVSVIDSRREAIYTNLQIDSLTKLSIEKLLDQLNIKISKNQRALICVDSAIGLPFQYKVKAKTIISQAKNFSYKNKSYGSYVAYKFFKSFQLEKKVRTEKRAIDIVLNAQSVFKLKPFQRNIACGSYRVLKDLSVGKKWYTLWPFENTKNSNFVICEGYPSYYWKSIFKQDKRNLEFFNKQNLKFKYLDQADSYVLACAGRKYQRAINYNRLSSKQKLEGWVLGHENK